MKFAAAVCFVMMACLCQVDAGWVPCWTFDSYRSSVSSSFSYVHSRINGVGSTAGSAYKSAANNKKAIGDVSTRVTKAEDLVKDLSSKLDKALQDVSALAARVAEAEKMVKKIDDINPCAIGPDSANMFMCMLLSAPTTVQA